MGKQKEMGNLVGLKVRARGFDQREWEEVSGAAQGESWGGGRGGAIQPWGVGCQEGSNEGQETETMLKPSVSPLSTPILEKDT